MKHTLKMALRSLADTKQDLDSAIASGEINLPNGNDICVRNGAYIIEIRSLIPKSVVNIPNDIIARRIEPDMCGVLRSGARRIRRCFVLATDKEDRDGNQKQQQFHANP